MVNSDEETALTSISQQESIDPIELANKISKNLHENFFDELLKTLENNNEYNEQIVKELMDEIIALRNELSSKERDVLICENAKLKMKVKEKSYEVAKLKENIKRLENNKNFFQKLFNNHK